MTTIRKYAGLLLLTCCGLQADAQRSPLAAQVMKTLKIPEASCPEELVAEKQLPYAPGTSIIVLPKFAEHTDDHFSLDCYIVLVDNKTGQILSRYYESHTTNGLESDAIRLERISIDAAPYKIKDNARAFGIRVSYSGSSRANPYDYETISLFLPEGKNLKNVLKNFTIRQYSGEWDTNCAGTFKSENKTINLTATKTNGFFDILIKSRINRIENTVKKGDCIEQKQSLTAEKTLKFRQGRYE